MYQINTKTGYNTYVNNQHPRNGQRLKNTYLIQREKRTSRNEE